MRFFLQHRTIIIICSGAVAEWLEFSAYLYLAPRLAELFFPEQDPSTALISVFGLFAIAYLTRPIGGFIFGYIGDRYGRRLALTLSVLIMALATTGIGVLPTWNSIGLMAPLLLLVCRILQGGAIAGEFTNAAIFMIEQGKGNPYLAGSWANWGANLGVALGALITALVSLPGMPDWAWRVPFLLSCITSLLALWIRCRIQESPAFQPTAARELTPYRVLKELALRYKGSCLAVALVGAFAGVSLYTGNMFWCSYVVSNGFFSQSQANVIASVDMGVEFIALPVMAVLAFRVGAKPIMLLGLFVTLLGAYLNFYMAQRGVTHISMLTMVLFALGVATFEAPMFKLLFDLFPAQIRCTGIALPWAIGLSLFSSPSPMVAQWLSGYYGWSGGVLCIALVSIAALFAIMIHTKHNKKLRAFSIF
ncbi:MFS transporter [Endozoicomonas sp.]|uniref:MFS transporter n=1 Tax=Endozoicomonas sp. TaxID=1892382 RepID=UPI003AF5AFA1